MTFFQLGAKHGNFTTQEAIHKTQLELFANEAELELSEEELNAVAGGAGGMPTCLNGMQASAGCFSDASCGRGHTCEMSNGMNICCTAIRNMQICPNGKVPVGSCSGGGRCPNGYTCNSSINLCC